MRLGSGLTLLGGRLKKAMMSLAIILEDFILLAFLSLGFL